MQKESNVYVINDGNPVFLGCRVESGALVLTRNGAPLGSSDMEVKLLTQEEITVTIADFDHDGNHYQVSAYSARDGVRTYWERIGEGVRSALLRAVASTTIVLDVTVEATSYAVSSDGSSPLYTPAAVKVRLPPPEDERPDPPAD